MWPSDGHSSLYCASEDTADDNRRDPAYSALLVVNPRTKALTRTPLKETVRGTPTLIAGVVYFVRPDGTVTAVNAAGGTTLWRKNTQVENLSAPTKSPNNDMLYFANRYGRLLALDRSTGTTRWTTAQLRDPGLSAEKRVPSIVMVKEAIVGVAGESSVLGKPRSRPSRADTERSCVAAAWGRFIADSPGAQPINPNDENQSC